MKEKTFVTPCGTIHYWTNDFVGNRPTVILLPGLTADHRLFDKQVEAFESEYNLLVWDAPGHAASRPFKLEFSLADKTKWLHSILEKEEIKKPIFIGQSMGGYVTQVFMQEFPNEIAGFVSIDSCPLRRKYYASLELWLLKHTKFLYKMYPWKSLVKAGAIGCAETEYGRQLMRDIMMIYDDCHDYYCELVSHGYKLLANAVELNLPYDIDCECLLLCGDHDKAGSAKSYNKRWAKQENKELVWVPNSGHNSNTDDYEFVNEKIKGFIEKINKEH